MATTREKMIDWLAELPDNTDVGIEQERLIVMIDNRAHFFEVGALSDESSGEQYGSVSRTTQSRDGSTTGDPR